MFSSICLFILSQMLTRTILNQIFNSKNNTPIFIINKTFKNFFFFASCNDWTIKFVATFLLLLYRPLNAYVLLEFPFVQLLHFWVSSLVSTLCWELPWLLLAIWTYIEVSVPKNNFSFLKIKMNFNVSPSQLAITVAMPSNYL